jgi:S-DNA-T family DNA segregation ATPase FtsK/SpoIIIE
MLYLPPGSAKLTRAQGVLVTDEEIHRIVVNLAAQGKPRFEESISAKLSSTIMPEDEVTDEEEDLVDQCLEIIRQEKKASTSMLQRRLRLGYTRAARIVDILEQRGILGPKDGARDREILVDLDELEG